MFKLYDFSFLIFSGILDTFFQGNFYLYLQIQSLPAKRVDGKLFCKGHKRKYFDFVGKAVFLGDYSTLWLWHENSQRRYANE